MMNKRLLSFLLVICMLVALLPVLALADDPTGTTGTTSATGTTSSTETTGTTSATGTTGTTSATGTTGTTSTTAATGTTTPTGTTETTAPTTPTYPGKPVSVNLCETAEQAKFLLTLTAYEGAPAVYAITDTSGTVIPVIDGTVPTDKYIKFEYPKGGIPTLTLKNAYLRSYGEVVDLTGFDLDAKLVVEGESKIESTSKRGIWRMCHGDLTIEGPGKLILNCFSTAISFEGDTNHGSLFLSNVTLDATTYLSVDRVLSIPAGNLTISSNSKVTLNHQNGIGIFTNQGQVHDAAGRGQLTVADSRLTVTGGNIAVLTGNAVTISNSVVQITGDKRALYTNNDLTVSGSTLVLVGKSNDLETLDVAKSFTIENSTVEVTSGKAPIFSATTKPVFVGNFNVLAGPSRNEVAAYSEAAIGSYRYLMAVPSTPDPTEPSTVPTTAPTDPSTATSSTAPTTNPTAAPTSTPTSAPTSAPTTTPTNAPTQAARPSGGGTNPLLWILVILLLVGAGAAAIAAVIILKKK